MSSIVDIVNNALRSKKYITWSECAEGQYQTTKFTLVKTKYGVRVRVEFGDFASFLPMKQEFTEEDVTALNEALPLLSYNGKDDNGKHLVQLSMKAE